MLYINNPEAFVAIETERRRSLGLRRTNDESPASALPVSRGL